MNNGLNLIKKTYTGFKASKIAKRFAALTLASAMVLSVVGCEIIFPPELTTTTTTTTTTTATPTTTTTIEPVEKPEIDISGYSEMLQNVLTNEYYDELVHDVCVEQNYDLLDTALFQPHPYYFLEDQGIDIEAIKNGETPAYTMSYVLDSEPNNLYVYTRVLQNNLHYQKYLIKYELTEQEMSDYNMLHTGKGSTRYYLQSVFLNEEISRTHTPEILGSSKIKTYAYDGMKETAHKSKSIDAELYDVIFLNPDEETGTFTVKVLPNFYDNLHMTFNSEIATIECRGRVNFANGVYTDPYSFGGAFRIESKEKEAGRVYLPQDTNLNISYCQDFENDHLNPEN